MADPSRISALWHAATEDVVFDDSVHVWQLGELAKALNGPVDATAVPISGFANTDVGNVVLWDKDQAKALFQSLR